MKRTDKQLDKVVDNLKEQLSPSEIQRLREEIKTNPTLLEDSMQIATERLIIEEKIKAARNHNQQQSRIVKLSTSYLKVASVAACLLVASFFYTSDYLNDQAASDIVVKVNPVQGEKICCSVYSTNSLFYTFPAYD